MTPYQPGDVLRLDVATEGLAPGFYVLLHVQDDPARALLAVAGEDDAGDVVATDRLASVTLYGLNACFQPTPIRQRPADDA